MLSRLHNTVYLACSSKQAEGLAIAAGTVYVSTGIIRNSQEMTGLMASEDWVVVEYLSGLVGGRPSCAYTIGLLVACNTLGNSVSTNDAVLHADVGKCVARTLQ